METVKITFPYQGYEPVYIHHQRLLAVLQPNQNNFFTNNDLEMIRAGMTTPIGALPLKEMVSKKAQILILVDDNTRITPTKLILPVVLEELAAAGIAAGQIKLLVASGTHRPLSREEKRIKYGEEIVERYQVLDHCWREQKKLTKLSTTSQGTEIWINKEIRAADFVIGIGQIVPHRVAGFSGGGKIVQPGICGPITTGQTHWLSALFDGADIIGQRDNPVRREIDQVCLEAGLNYIINTIPDGSGHIYRCVCGDPIKAHQVGCKLSLDIFAVPLSEQGDIVIADSYPADLELWQAAKGIFSADLALKDGGILVLVSPCTEGVAVEHPLIIEKGYRGFSQVKEMVENGEINDLTVAAHLAHVGRVCRDKGKCIMVSSGIDAAIAKKLGFNYAKTPQEGLNMAFKLKGTEAKVVVLQNGGEIMPLLA
ncbi:MAG: nickel-dependent lactate racemase [Halanaerobiales bacterium]|nr:nickel-dependent lactate racemase [Halanaerobiales bacterium]